MLQTVHKHLLTSAVKINLLFTTELFLSILSLILLSLPAVFTSLCSATITYINLREIRVVGSTYTSSQGLSFSSPSSLTLPCQEDGVELYPRESNAKTTLDVTSAPTVRKENHPVSHPSPPLPPSVVAVSNMNREEFKEKSATDSYNDTSKSSDNTDNNDDKNNIKKKIPQPPYYLEFEDTPRSSRQGSVEMSGSPQATGALLRHSSDSDLRLLVLPATQFNIQSHTQSYGQLHSSDSGNDLNDCVESVGWSKSSIHTSNTNSTFANRRNSNFDSSSGVVDNNIYTNRGGNYIHNNLHDDKDFDSKNDLLANDNCNSNDIDSNKIHDTCKNNSIDMTNIDGNEINNKIYRINDRHSSSHTSNRSVDSNSKPPEEFIPISESAWEISKELFTSKTFWRFSALTLLLINLKAIFRHLDATLPTYLIRTFGANVPKGTIYSINPFIIILLTPLVAALTGGYAHFDMIKYGSYLTAVSPFFLAFSTSIWATVW
jgi:hypothetical protein